MSQKFSIAEIARLRSELLQARLDSFQAAETIQIFVAGHGYGISAEMARDAVAWLEIAGHNVEPFRKRLETSALVM